MDSDRTELQPASDQADPAESAPVDDADEDCEWRGTSYHRDLGVWMREGLIVEHAYDGWTFNAGGDVFFGGDWFFTVERVAGEWYGRVDGLEDVAGANDRIGPFDSEVEAYRAVSMRLLAYVVLATGGTSWTSSPLVRQPRDQ